MDDYDSSVYSVDAVLDQEAKIREDIAALQPLVGPKESLDSLEAQYKNNPKFLHKIQLARSRYSHLRRIRGDGSCFYRSYLFSILEYAILPPPQISPSVHYQQVSQFFDQFQRSFHQIITEGTYSSVAIDDFYETTLELVTWATAYTLQQGNAKINISSNTADDQNQTSISPTDPTADFHHRQQLLVELEQKMNDESTAQWYMTWLRCLTSAQLQRDPEAYTPYLTNHSSIIAFCAAEVDSLNREVDALQCLALTNEMKVAVQIEYLDGSEGGLHGYVIPEGQQPFIAVLYRPGHYDVLYQTEQTRK